jgi:hypothetical protein
MLFVGLVKSSNMNMKSVLNGCERKIAKIDMP